MSQTDVHVRVDPPTDGRDPRTLAIDTLPSREVLALMVRLGKTYSDLMVDVRPSNAKLRGRVLAILEEATRASEEESVRALEEADGDTRTALVSLLAGIDAEAARAALGAADGRVRAALAALDVSPGHTATTTDEVPMEQ